MVYFSSPQGGRTGQQEGKNMAKKERFEKIYSQGTVDVMQIWRDTETGVNYVFHKEGYAGGMTPLLDKDGKSVVTLSESN